MEATDPIQDAMAGEEKQHQIVLAPFGE